MSVRVINVYPVSIYHHAGFRGIAGDLPVGIHQGVLVQTGLGILV